MSEDQDQGAKKPNLAGKYSHVKSENFEGFLAANGAPWMIRKMAGTAKPDLDVVQDGDKFEIRSISTFKTKEHIFTLGEEFEEAQHDGSKMKVIANWEGDKLVMKFTPMEGCKSKPQTHTRELNGDEIKVTMEVGDVTATRLFKRKP